MYRFICNKREKVLYIEEEDCAQQSRQRSGQFRTHWLTSELLLRLQWVLENSLNERRRRVYIYHSFASSSHRALFCVEMNWRRRNRLLLMPPSTMENCKWNGSTDYFNQLLQYMCVGLYEIKGRREACKNKTFHFQLRLFTTSLSPTLARLLMKFGWSPTLRLMNKTWQTRFLFKRDLSGFERSKLRILPMARHCRHLPILLGIPHAINLENSVKKGWRL